MSDPGSGSQDDDFGVRLDWPADALADPYDGPDHRDDADKPVAPDTTPFQPTSAPPPTRVVPPAPPVVPAPPPPPSMADALAGLADSSAPGLGRALAAIAARVDVLSSTTVTFRNLVSDRYQEQTRWVSELMTETTAEISRVTRVQERAVADLRTQLDEVWRLLLEVSASTDTLAAAFDAHVANTGSALASLAEELKGIRRRTPVRSRPVSDAEHVQAVADAVVQALRSDAGGAPAPARRPPRRRA